MLNAETVPLARGLCVAGKKILSSAACILLFTLAGPHALCSQETASLVGMVLDQEDLRPLPGALVSLPESPHRTRTDAEGRFELVNVPGGDLLIRVEAEGYVTFVETLEVAPMEESLVHFHLNRLSAVLKELMVEVPGLQNRDQGHAETVISGIGGSQRSAADLLKSNVPGVTVRTPQGGAGMGVRIRLRGVSSFVLNEEPHIYVDGARIDAGGLDGAMLTLAQIPATSVVRIRVLRGPASTSMYPNAAAGVILVETMGPGE